MRRSKLGVPLILEVLGSQCEIQGLTSEFFLLWAIIGRVVVEPYFKGIQRIKRVVHLLVTLLWRSIGPLADIKSIRYEDICRWHRIFGTGGSVYMPSINVDRRFLSRRRSYQKIFFSTNNTFPSIIMMISVVLCQIDEEINYVSIFHNQVVRIWLRNRPAKLSWNRNKNS